MNIRLLAVFTLFLGSHFLTSAQGEKSPYRYSYVAELNRGFIMKHGPEVGIISRDARPNGFAFHLIKHTYGYRKWEKEHNYPTFKFSFNYFDLNQQYLGNLFGLSTTLQFPILKKERFQIDFATGIGVSYNDKPFDMETNNKNVLLGSHINTVIRGDLSFAYEVTDNWATFLNIGIYHASNGSFTKPNKGINIINGGLGARYTPFTSKPDLSEVPTLEDQGPKNLKYTLTASGGMQQEASFDVNEREPFYNFLFLYYPILQNRGKWAVGLDYFHNLALKKDLSRHPAFINDTPPDFRRVGMTGGYEVSFGRFGALFQLGYYLYNEAHPGQLFYQRYSARYQLTDFMGFHFALRSHLGNAENIELGIFAGL
ncbi:acyloxyacyl hydrolase [Mangrovivirga sp. M17]|uniref:Acyloxyacyl hydrolase n=1 Tax=Mangrovivirga halotolerans TaxID=2993936 RepID=A0ABT3RLH4_9BACT|nr:acyloxyacyl hydrolase [Mangrovivirga halotolerans]MCX2742640.1 acyloxyacyl hydrolase [Mangrovivirga halotolerans]